MLALETHVLRDLKVHQLDLVRIILLLLLETSRQALTFLLALISLLLFPYFVFDLFFPLALHLLYLLLALYLLESCGVQNWCHCLVSDVELLQKPEKLL